MSKLPDDGSNAGLPDELKAVWDAAAPSALGDKPDVNGAWRTVEARLRSETDAEPRPWFANLWGWAIPLTALALVLVAAVFFLRGSHVVFETKPGQQKSMKLPDGSIAHLHGGSRLTYEPEGFGSEQRALTLDYGEAFFEVEKRTVAFVVAAPHSVVQVLGTAFNLYARDEDTRVMVTRGLVAVKKDGHDNLVRLRAGETISFSADQDLPPPMVSPYRDGPGWRVGALHTQDTPLPEICRELENRYGISIVLSRPNLAQLKVSGMLKGDQPEDYLDALAALLALQYERDHERFFIR